jgi:hypothetical protein
MANATVDFDAHYAVDGYRGIAFYLRGYATRQVEVEDSYELDGETYYDYSVETIEDDSMVRAVMVGDDREHIVDVDDLTVISEDDYCSGCGQIGCGHDGRGV